jgi:tRNA threonylcarbamoyladenosine biosynthesis protein TsaE
MAGPLELATASPEETRDVGEALAGTLREGDVVSLTGDLGAGKTTLVQGVARGLGVRDPVLSPTFTLVREYRGLHRVYHVDIYRLDRVQDVLDLGFEELLDSGGVVLIEWGDAIEALLPDSSLRVEILLREDREGREGPSVRRMVLTGGGDWEGRWDGVARALWPWRAGEGGRP